MNFYIAVPVYNAEAFLADCVNSVLAQTVQDFEIVLVDDGSPDGSGALCDTFAGQDERIHVIHQKIQAPTGHAGRRFAFCWSMAALKTGWSFWMRTTA